MSPTETSAATESPDPTMTEIGAALALAGAGDTAAAGESLLRIWDRIGAAGDPLHRCGLAHYLADLFEDPAQALVWDVRALDAVEALTDERARRHHDSLRVAGFRPSLHLNLADNFRRLGSFDATAEHIAAVRRHQDTLADDAYGAMIRQATTEVAAAIEQRSTEPRPGAPGAVSDR
ncbi:hypothetical protein CFN78_25730 [Amycolatopsis antarctica]|uniref:Tetratricopeptide repeat protein n=1 Tax=Amycolatopsis antarctica TaxID=1854586 RepID=A0A263CY28_9PSEU|nr:hypothetical protein [Amycolatopsis antarctica]OZM70327.1 hypothetical protein CFN78_25730 [Amycolatopsis antarctica]